MRDNVFGSNYGFWYLFPEGEDDDSTMTLPWPIAYVVFERVFERGLDLLHEFENNTILITTKIIYEFRVYYP